MRRLVLLLSVAVAASSLAFSPFPGGVLDSTGRTAYLASPAGVDTIDLTKGDLVCRFVEIQKPLFVVGDRLYGLALSNNHRFAIVAFELTGVPKRIMRVEIDSLPQWVVTQDSPTHRFAVTWRMSGKTLILDWQATARATVGLNKNASGQLHVDLETSRKQVMAVALGQPQSQESLPPQFTKHSVRWHRRQGDRLLAVISEDANKEIGTQKMRKMVHRTWDVSTGKVLASQELMIGNRLLLLESLDGEQLWVRETNQSPDKTENKPLFWSVFGALDGRLLGRVPHIAGAQVVLLLQSRAYCLSHSMGRVIKTGETQKTTTLHAIDAERGAVLWRYTPGEAIPKADPRIQK
jgi:hypothetical protein